MSKAAAKTATKSYEMLHRAGLTAAQENAVDALAAGKRDAEAAALVGVNRVTVTRWRLYNPHFQVALADRRRALWAASLDQLRGLVVLALDAVAESLADKANPNRTEAAFTLLKMVPLSVGPLAGPTDPDEIVRAMVDEERRRCRGFVENFEDEQKGLPPYEEHVAQVWDRLAAKMGGSDADADELVN